jgi:hypothetical protein
VFEGVWRYGIDELEERGASTLLYQGSIKALLRLYYGSSMEGLY